VREIPGRPPVEMVAVSKRAADDAPDTNYVAGGRPVAAHNLIGFLSAPRFASRPAPRWRVIYAMDQRMHLVAVTFAVWGRHILSGQRTVAPKRPCVSCCLAALTETGT